MEMNMLCRIVTDLLPLNHSHTKPRPIRLQPVLLLALALVPVLEVRMIFVSGMQVAL